MYSSLSSPEPISANCILYLGTTYCSELGFDICKFSTSKCIISLAYIIINRLFKVGFIFCFLFAIFKLNTNLRNEFNYSLIGGHTSEV